MSDTHPMKEGIEAQERFKDALKKVLAVQKSAVPNPFNKAQRKDKKVEKS